MRSGARAVSFHGYRNHEYVLDRGPRAGVLLAGVLKQRFGLNAIFAAISALCLVSGAVLVLAYRLWTYRDIARALPFDTADPTHIFTYYVKSPFPPRRGG